MATEIGDINKLHNKRLQFTKHVLKNSTFRTKEWVEMHVFGKTQKHDRNAFTFAKRTRQSLNIENFVAFFENKVLIRKRTSFFQFMEQNMRQIESNPLVWQGKGIFVYESTLLFFKTNLEIPLKCKKMP